MIRRPPCYSVARVLFDVRYAGARLTLEGDRLILEYGNAANGPLPDELKRRIQDRREMIIDALKALPAGCPHHPQHVMAGRCIYAECVHLDESQ
jgi:hypothetical protein